MKKIFLSFVTMAIMLIALCLICSHFNGFAPSKGLYYSAQLKGVIEWLPTLIITAFFLGFIPTYIHESMKAMQPQTAQAEKCQANSQPALKYAFTVIPVLLAMLLIAQPTNNSTGSTKEAPQTAQAAPQAAQPVTPEKRAVKHQRPHRSQQQNFKVNKCASGYYIAGEIPNGFNSTF